MPYTAADGVQTFTGTDAFSPPAQAKTTVDGAVQYHNSVIVTTVSDMLALTAMHEGWTCYVTAIDILFYYNGSTWFPITGGMRQMTPTVAGAGVTVSAGGTVTASGAASISLNNAFDINISDHYMVDFNISAMSVAGSPNLRMRAAGVDDASGNYSNTLRQSNASTTSSSPVSAGTSLPISGTGVAHFLKYDIYNPAAALATRITGGGYTAASGGVHIDESSSGSHGLGTAYDGFTILPSGGGTITGIFRVYAYGNS